LQTIANSNNIQRAIEGIDSDEKGNVYFNDWFNQRITKYRKNCNGLYELELFFNDDQNSGYSFFNYRGLLADNLGKIYLVDGVRANVQIYSPPLPPLPAPGHLSRGRRGLVAGTANNKAFFIGGFGANFCGAFDGFAKNIDIYDATSDTWSVDYVPQNLDIVSSDSYNRSVVIDNKIYTWRYINLDVIIYIYDVINNSWNSMNLPTPRSGFKMHLVGNKIYFSGGSDNSNGNLTNLIEIYDTSTGSWTTNYLPEARYEITVTSLGNKVFFAGGFLNGNPSTRVDILDLNTNAWSQIQMTEPRGAFGIDAAGNKVIFAGGSYEIEIYEDYFETIHLNSVDIYDISTGVITTEYLSIARNSMKTAVMGGKILLIAGTDENGYYSNLLEIYDTNTGLWSSMLLSKGRYQFGLATIGNKLILAGGITATPSGVYNSYSDDIEIIELPTQAPQALTFSPLPPKTFGDTPFVLDATASSGLPVSYESDNTNVAIISGDTLTIVGAGTANITASQAGDANHLPATDVIQLLTVNKASQVIAFDSIPQKAFGDAPIVLNATASSGLSVGYFSSNPAVVTISGDTVTIVGSGIAQITASQAGDEDFEAAEDVSRTLVVSQANQTITFNALPNKLISDLPFVLIATASSGLAVSFSSANPAVATISGDTVTIVGAGSTQITASQAGDGNFSPAPDVSQTLNVNACPATLSTPTGMSFSNITTDTATATWQAVANAEDYELRYALATTAQWTNVVVNGTSANLTGLLSGMTYQVQIRSRCGSTLSNYSSNTNFTTIGTPVCAVPTGLTAASITSTAATISWGVVSGAYQYTLRYRVNGTTAWTTLNVGNNTDYNLTGLNAGTTYQINVRARCSSTVYSAYRPTVTFATVGTGCPSITTVTLSNLQQTSATATWTIMGGATGYQVSIRLASASVFPTNTNVAANSFTFTGLAPNTTYRIRLRAVCGAGVFSTYINRTFTTLPTGAVPRFGEIVLEEEPEIQAIQVFPNPAQDILSIKLPTAWEEESIAVQLVSTTGEVVYQGQPKNTSEVRLDVRHLSKGLYFLKITTNRQGLITKKVVIQ
jgi:hypothetical protein